MRFTVRWVVGGLSVVVLTMAGCAATHHIALDNEAAAKIKTVRLISIIPQAVVVPTIEPSSGAKSAESVGMMFGAIGGAIGEGLGV